MIITCALDGCKKQKDVPTGHYNRSVKKGAKMYCSRECSRLGHRSNKTEEQKKEEKRLYDIEYRKRPGWHEKHRESWKRNYDPVKAAIKRKERMPYHVEYCRSPEYKAWKKKYDREHRAKKDYGEFWESQVLRLELENEVEKLMPRYERDLELGRLNKSQRRKRDVGTQR